MSGRKFTNSELLGIIKLYNDGYGTVEIAKIYSRHRSSIQEHLKKGGIKLRKTSPYIGKYNIRFFDYYNKESCYWAGFIAADGCVRATRATVSIHINKIDAEHLRKFCVCIGYTGGFVDDTKNNSIAVHVNGNWFPPALLANFDIGTHKSKRLCFPPKLPHKYAKEFIRGVFDGDGSIGVRSYGKNNQFKLLTFSVVGTREMLEGIRLLLLKEVGIYCKSKNTEGVVRKTGNIYSLSFAGRNALRIFNWFYKKSDVSLRLDRKYVRYIEYLRETSSQIYIKAPPK